MIKKIETRQDVVKKEKRLQLILAGILIFVLFGSVFGIVVNSFGSSQDTSKVSYNGYNFEIENGYYTLNLGILKFYFSFNPNEIKDLDKDFNVTRKISSYANKEVYVSSEDYSSYSEIVQNFNQYVSRTQQACKDGEKCLDSNLPIKTCEDNLIVIKESTINKVYENNNCIYIEGKKDDLLKLTDEFLLYEIGVNK